jgi:hypothetical protein
VLGVRTTATGRILQNFGRYTYGTLCGMCFKHDGAYSQFYLQLETSLTIISLENAQASTCLQSVSPVSSLELPCLVMDSLGPCKVDNTISITTFEGQHSRAWSILGRVIATYTAAGNSVSVTHYRAVNTVVIFPRNAREEAMAQDRTRTPYRDLSMMCRQRNALLHSILYEADRTRIRQEKLNKLGVLFTTER